MALNRNADSAFEVILMVLVVPKELSLWLMGSSNKHRRTLAMELQTTTVNNNYC